MLNNTSRKGPWFYKVGGGGEYFIICSKPMYDIAAPECEFLAHICHVDGNHKEEADMVAAAPELYDAGKLLLERLAAYREPEEWPQSMREAIAELRAAIAKAEGKQQHNTQEERT